MDLTANDTLHMLLVLFLMLSAAHSLGYAFQRMRQPAVVGEILGGLLLGPTVLGALFPDVHAALFQHGQGARIALGAFPQLGLVLLMFCSGLEMQTLLTRQRSRSMIAVALAGTFVPFFMGMVLVRSLDLSAHMGKAANDTAFLLVFAAAFAVTSIPVISRIFHDLGVLETPFAKLVLMAALFEDIGLYVILSAAVALANGAAGPDAGASPSLVWHIAGSLGFFGGSLLIGPRVFAWLARHPCNLPARKSPAGFLLLFLFLVTAAALSVGISPMLSAFAAGMVASRAGGLAGTAGSVVHDFAFSFPIPVYFATVGLKLDLLRHFDPIFFVLFFVGAMLVKGAGVYAGARWAGETRSGSRNLAAAMNARGGPCIVLASAALDANIVSDGFYTTLVVLAVTSSMAAGAWLDVAARKNPSLL